MYLLTSCDLTVLVLGQVFKHLTRDPAASVNAMKQITCVIVILAYFT